MGYIDFNDKSIPLGKRKVAYVKWAISKGTSVEKAMELANKKFGFERKGHLTIIVVDYGRMHQNSFRQRELTDPYYDEIRRSESYDVMVTEWNDVYAREYAKAHSTKDHKYVVNVLVG